MKKIDPDDMEGGEMFGQEIMGYHGGSVEL